MHPVHLVMGLSTSCASFFRTPVGIYCEVVHLVGSPMRSTMHLMSSTVHAVGRSQASTMRIITGFSWDFDEKVFAPRERWKLLA